MSTLERVQALVESMAKAPMPSDTQDSLFEAGVIDSFAVMELVALLEESFSIQVPDDDMVPRKFETLDRIVAYVDARLGA